MDYSNLTPVIVPPSTTLADLAELARFNGWSRYRYDGRRKVLYAVTQPSRVLLREERTSMFLRPQAC